MEIVRQIEKSLVKTAIEITKEYKGLGKETAKNVALLLETGIDADQARDLLNIPYQGVSAQGAPNKVINFTQALLDIYGDKLPTTANFYAMAMEMEEIGMNVEEFRRNHQDLNSTFTYKECFMMHRNFGLETIETLIDDIEQHVGGKEKDKRAVKAILLKNILKESEERGVSPDAVLSSLQDDFDRYAQDDEYVEGCGYRNLSEVMLNYE